MLIDKFKTCKDCPDRCASPNCHMTCEGYLHRVKMYEGIRRQRAIETQLAIQKFDAFYYRHKKGTRSAAFKRRAKYRNQENLEGTRRA